MTYSVSHLENDPAVSEVVIEIANADAGEIWNVNVRLDTGYLGMCPAVYQLGRIPAGATKRIRSRCILLDTQIANLLIWRIDFDSEAGHSQIVTTGFNDSESVAEGS